MAKKDTGWPGAISSPNRTKHQPKARSGRWSGDAYITLPVPPHPPRILPASLAEPHLGPTCGWHPCIRAWPRVCGSSEAVQCGFRSESIDVRNVFANPLKRESGGLHSTRCCYIAMPCGPWTGVGILVAHIAQKAASRWSPAMCVTTVYVQARLWGIVRFACGGRRLGTARKLQTR